MSRFHASLAHVRRGLVGLALALTPALALSVPLVLAGCGGGDEGVYEPGPLEPEMDPEE